jgi:hypothetical protein
MPLEIQNQWISVTGDQVTFAFNNPVEQYLVGVSSFKMSYAAGTDHHVKQMSISLSPNQPSAKTVTVSATVILTDADGHQIDPSQSHLYVSAVAWTGSPPDGLLLSGPIVVANNATSPPISLPGVTNPVLQAAQSGFYLAYADTDHHVEFVQASVSGSSNGSQGFINASVNMYDASGNAAYSPTATGLLVASSVSNPGFVVQPYTAQNGGYNTITMPQPISDAVVLLTGWQVVYPDGDDHHVETIGAGPDSVQVDPTDATKVQTNGVWAYMNDDSGHSQDNNNSNCSLVVIGIPLL